MRFSPNTANPIIVSGRWDKYVKVWNLTNIKLKTGYLNSVTLPSDDSLCPSWGKDGMAMLRGTSTMSNIFTLWIAVTTHNPHLLSQRQQVRDTVRKKLNILSQCSNWFPDPPSLSNYDKTGLIIDCKEAKLGLKVDEKNLSKCNFSDHKYSRLQFKSVVLMKFNKKQFNPSFQFICNFRAISKCDSGLPPSLPLDIVKKYLGFC